MDVGYSTIVINKYSKNSYSVIKIANEKNVSFMRRTIYLLNN